MSNEITANQSAYEAAIEAMKKEAIQAAQNNVTMATVAHTMTGRPASPEAEQLIEALFNYIRCLEELLNPEERIL